MTNYPHDRHSLSKLYREDTLQEARTRHLVEQAKAGREPRELGGLASFGRTRWRCCGERSSRNSSSLGRKDAK